jgi:hypothetical protein
LLPSIGWDCPDCHDLKLSNRPVRTRMPGGVAGAQPIMAAPYADRLPNKIMLPNENVQAMHGCDAAQA